MVTLKMLIRSLETGARKLFPLKYCAKLSLGSPIGKIIDEA